MSEAPPRRARSGIAAAEPRFERRQPAFQLLLRHPRLGGHRLDRVEFLAANEVHMSKDTLDLFPHPRLEFVAHAGQGADRAGRDTGEIVEQASVALHGRLLCRLPSYGDE
jgi:hypothetical protein